MRNPSKKTNKLFAFRDFQKIGMITSLHTDSGKYQYYKHLWYVDAETDTKIKLPPDKSLKSSRQDCRFQFIYTDYKCGNRWYDFNYFTLKKHRR